MQNTLTTLLIFALCGIAWGQDLSTERIRKISTKKRSVFLDSGIFHNGGARAKSGLKAVRHNFSKRMGYERVVFDFTTKEVPRIYGHIDAKNNKLFFDLFKTDLQGGKVDSFGKSNYVKSINFFPISSESVSVEVVFNEKVNLDIFYLESPGRLVVDIKNN